MQKAKVTTGFIMVVTFAFCIGNLDEAIAPSYSYAYIDVFYNSTGSKAGATVMACLIILMCLCSTISNVATASRQMFAFARDRGLPFSGFLARVSQHSSHHPGIRTNVQLSGPPRLGHPPQRRLRLLRHHLPPLSHQPRQRRRFQRHSLPHSRRNPQLLHHLHLLRRSPQNAQRSSPARTMESRPRWSGLQYHRCIVLAVGVCLRILSVGTESGSVGDELEFVDLWVCGAVFDCVLLYFWEACL